MTIQKKNSGRTSSTRGEREAALTELRTIPGIGPSLSRDLWSLGIGSIADLKGKNPKKMYERLNRLTGTRQDPCVLYVFRCAVYFATEPRLQPARLRWWYWKDKAYNE